MNELPKNYFKNEAKFMVWSIIAIIVVALIAAILIPFIYRQITIDRCLDAGGSYNHETNKCIIPPLNQNESK